MMKYTNDLGKDPIFPLVLRLAIPTMLAQFVSVLYSIVDRMYIGAGVGDLALAGVGVCAPIVTLLSSFASLIGLGGSPIMAMRMGAGDRREAQKILNNSFFMLLVTSVLLTFGFLALKEKFLMWFGASQATFPYANTYVTIYTMGTVFALLSTGMNSFLIAQGFSGLGMVTVMLGALFNIVLDPVFIFAFGMGVRGAALATVLSQAVSCIWVLRFLCGKKTLLHIRKKYLRMQAKVIIPCITLGLATFIMQASESVVTVCFNSSLLRYGGDIAVGAMTILTSVMQFALLPLQGIAQGAQPISSYNYGARNADRVKKTFRLLLITCFTYSMALWAAVQLFPKLFVSIFTSDAALVSFTAHMLKIYLGGLGLFGIQIACQMTFTSLGKAVCSIIVAVVRKFVLLLPLIYLMPHLVSDSTRGVYMAEPAADVTAVLFTIVLFTLQFKKAMKNLQN